MGEARRFYSGASWRLMLRPLADAFALAGPAGQSRRVRWDRDRAGVVCHCGTRLTHSWVWLAWAAAAPRSRVGVRVSSGSGSVRAGSGLIRLGTGSRAPGSQPSGCSRVATSFVTAAMLPWLLPRLRAARPRFRFRSVRLGGAASFYRIFLYKSSRQFDLQCLLTFLSVRIVCPTLVVRVGWSPSPARAGTCRATAGSGSFWGRDGLGPASRDVMPVRSSRPSSSGMLQRRRRTRGPLAAARALGSPGSAHSVLTPWSLQRRFCCVCGF
jgi:hypothetical protein